MGVGYSLISGAEGARITKLIARFEQHLRRKGNIFFRVPILIDAGHVAQIEV